MSRLARSSAFPTIAALALLSSACSSPPPSAAQSADAAVPAATSAAPASLPAGTAGDAAVPAAERPKFYRPVKGEATVEVIRGASRRAGEDMVTVVKIRNSSPGRIDLLRVDEYWYDKDLEHVSGAMERWRQPFNPGDVIELTLKSPMKPNLYRSTLTFSHANGTISAKEVKTFPDDM